MTWNARKHGARIHGFVKQYHQHGPTMEACFFGCFVLVIGISSFYLVSPNTSRADFPFALNSTDRAPLSGNYALLPTSGVAATSEGNITATALAKIQESRPSQQRLPTKLSIHTSVQPAKSLDWRHETLAIAKNAYDRWKRVVACKEPVTSGGILIRLNNTSFRFFSQGSKANQVVNKTCGGDEYYVFLVSPDLRESIATFTDHEDGSYTFRFDSTCGEEMSGNVTAILQFSQGNSFVLKKKIEYLKRIVVAHLPGVVIQAQAAPEADLPPRQKKWIEAPTLETKFDQILTIGCSLMQGVTSKVIKESNGKVRLVRTNSALDLKSLRPRFYDTMDGYIKLYEAAKDKKKVAIIFNSGIWDVLLARPTAEVDHPPEQMYANHLKALSLWADFIKANFSEAAIFYKETTTLLPHETMCSFISRDKLHYKCQVRNMFMSSSLTRLLRDLQEVVMRAKGITVLRQYDSTYRHSSFVLDGDGRHFGGMLNDFMWRSWSYIDGQWTTQMLCPSAFYNTIKSWYPSYQPKMSQGLLRSFVRSTIKM